MKNRSKTERKERQENRTGAKMKKICKTWSGLEINGFSGRICPLHLMLKKRQRESKKV